MTKTEIELIKRALDLLHKLVPDDELRAVDLTPRRFPVLTFAKRYLAPDPVSDLACEELWKFYSEVMATGELAPMRKQAFLRMLPGAMVAVFNTRKSHDLKRAGGRVRGFKGITVREHVRPVAVELEPEAM